MKAKFISNLEEDLQIENPSKPQTNFRILFYYYQIGFKKTRNEKEIDEIFYADTRISIYLKLHPILEIHRREL